MMLRTQRYECVMHEHSKGFLCKSQNEVSKMLLGKQWISEDIKI
jgi:hypothetical protein